MFNSIMLAAVKTNSKFVNAKMLPIITNDSDMILAARMNMFFTDLENVVQTHRSKDENNQISMEDGVKLVKETQGFKTAITDVVITDETIEKLIIERQESFWDK